jgi:hypothetical protein
MTRAGRATGSLADVRDALAGIQEKAAQATAAAAPTPLTIVTVFRGNLRGSC